MMKKGIMQPLLFALFFATLMASLPIDVFYDRANYLQYASSSSLIILRYFNQGLLSLLFNEPVWLLINLLLSFFISAEAILRFIVFFSTFTTFYLTLKNNHKVFLFALFLLMFPQIIKNDLVHLRQGLALSFFLIGWFSNRNKTKFFFIGLAPFIHSSFFFLDFLLVTAYFFNRMKLSRGLKVFTVTLIGFVLSSSFVFIALSLGARQADLYSETSADISGLAFVFWSFVLFLFISQGRLFATKRSFEMIVLVFYLSTYFFMPVGARIFESAILLVLLAGKNLTNWRLHAFLLAAGFYFVLSYLPRIGQPWLGWGPTGGGI